jgi:hypothetical protein
MKNRQILSKDARKFLKDGVICYDKWIPAIVIAKGFLHRLLLHLINCGLHSVSFVALLTQSKLQYFALFYKYFIRRAYSSNSGC